MSSTPLSAPVIAATRLRDGNATSAAAILVTQAISAVRQADGTGTIVVRADSAYYSAAVIGAARRSGARFSVTAPMNSGIRAAITAIPAERMDRHQVPAGDLG